ncbi:peptidylprolyl isomerase [Desulfatirhabdium butyrativorans]|uniref:peptidylprolyl isomerase n=1 Tax=Desulfatirhabdium butyrativorans TaxID=340467 RepID=UPI000487DD98|nr:peptidylprolyl isomerase [Desulfatirhabdium butyrativorans]
MKKMYPIGRMVLATALLVALAFAPGFAQDKKADAAKTKSNPAKKETAAKAKASDPNAKVALVNGKPILRSELDGILNNMKGPQAMGGAAAEAPTKEMQDQALDHAITLAVLKQECAKQHIETTDAEVDERIQQIKKNFPSDKDFDAMLQKINLTQQKLKENLKTDLTIRKLIDKEVGSKVAVSDEEIKSYYDSHPDQFKHAEQVRASHILVKVGPNDTPEQKAEAHKKIEEIQKKLQGGEDFATLAKEQSDCPSKAKGGDLGFFDKNAMVKPFSDAAFALKPGETSGIVETQFGYHIIKQTDKKPEGTQTFDEVKEDIARHLKQTKMQAEVKTYIDGLKKNAKIEKLI